MTANSYKRIRARLERSAKIALEAHEIARAGHAPHGIIALTARGADDAASALRELDAWDQRMAQQAEAIARQLREEAGMTEEEKQAYRRRQFEEATQR